MHTGLSTANNRQIKGTMSQAHGVVVEEEEVVFPYSHGAFENSLRPVYTGRKVNAKAGYVGAKAE